jgi:hypothetical protein
MILKNTILPIKIENRKYATIEHYVLSSLLKDPNRDVLLSYPADKIRNVFNYYDQEQYTKVVYDACNKFNEKKCRSIEQMGDDKKTLGSLTRSLIRSHDDFIYKTSVEPFHTVVGLNEVENILYGYNMIGHSILRMKYVLDKLPDLSGPMEYIFWKSHPEYQNIKPLKNNKTYKTIMTGKTKREKNVEAEDEIIDYFVDDGDEDEENEEKEEAGYNPEEVVPIYTNDRVRWIATSVNSRLDDMRDVGAKADFLYSYDAPMTDPFHDPNDIYSRIDPLSIFKIYKATEHLVGMMRNGMDIRVFLNKSVDTILLECRVSPELFGRSIDSKQRQMIYVDFWYKFISKTIPYYHLIEKEIMYPQNLAGFVRKEYAIELNDRIGQKIREILFASFIFQVIEKSYPHVAPELRTIVMTREMKSFNEEEYNDITDKLYHLFFQQKFQLDDEGVRRVMLLESFRLTTEEIENAIHFIPCKILSKPSLDIRGTILDPMTMVDVKIDDKIFHDMYQYIFYRLFIFYGSLTPKEAYQYLFENGEMMMGVNPQLQTILNNLISAKKDEYTRQGILAKLQQYPQIKEIILYSRATKTPIRDDDNLWNDVGVDPLDLQLMKWVVSVIPSGDRHFEKSIHLYSFLHDMVRSLGIMKSIVGRRLQQKSLEIFIRCFYSKLDKINKGVKIPKTRMPAGFSSYIEATKTIGETFIDELWKAVHPLVYIFQQKKFVPSELFEEARQANPSVSKDEMIRALANVVMCIYPNQEVSNDQLYLLTQMISGKDDIPMWPEPSFEMIREVEDNQDSFAHLPEEIRKRLPKRKKTTKKDMENVSFHIVHPSFESKRKDIQNAFGRPSLYDPVVSRASYALAALEKETINPRRIVFHL